MHRKSVVSLGISNSNLAGVIIGLQRTRKVKKEKKKSKFCLSSTLNGQIVFCAPARLMYLIEAEFTQKTAF